MAFPKAHRKRLASTNPLERLNAETKRRTDVVGIFPNDAAIVRFVGALLLEQNDEWQLQRRYTQREGLQTATDNEKHRTSAVVTTDFHHSYTTPWDTIRRRPRTRNGWRARLDECEARTVPVGGR